MYMGFILSGVLIVAFLGFFMEMISAHMIAGTAFEYLSNVILSYMFVGIAYGYAYLRIGVNGNGKKLGEASMKEIAGNIGYGILTFLIMNVGFWGMVYILEGVWKILKPI